MAIARRLPPPPGVSPSAVAARAEPASLLTRGLPSDGTYPVAVSLRAGQELCGEVARVLLLFVWTCTRPRRLGGNVDLLYAVLHEQVRCPRVPCAGDVLRGGLRIGPESVSLGMRVVVSGACGHGSCWSVREAGRSRGAQSWRKSFCPLPRPLGQCTGF